MDVVALQVAKADAAKKYTPRALPGSIPTTTALSGRYEPRAQVYNMQPGSLRRARARLAAAAAGGARFRWLAIGDSITRGVGADKATTSYPAAVAALSTTGTGIPAGGSGIVFPAADTRWVMVNNGFAQQTTTGFAYYTPSGSSGAMTATFTSLTAGTQIDLYYRGQTSSMTVSIDGGAATTIPSSNTQNIKVQSFTGLANTIHTVVVTASGTFCYIFGVDIHSGTGLAITNAGLSGSKTSDWTVANYDGPLQVAQAWAPHFVTIELGTNNAGAGSSIAAYQSDLTQIANTFLTAGIDVAFIGMPPRLSSDVLPYLAAMYQTADALNVPLVDWYDRWGTYSSANTLGIFSGDGLHPNAIGYADFARALVRALALT